MKLYLVAGEASGDNHAAELLRALHARDPQLRFFGRGGPKMRALAEDEFRDWIDQAAIVGLWEVLKQYSFFRREFASTIQEITALKPEAVVLIDYPGFNLRLARALRDRIPELKIIYYISPQVWAWNRRRVNSIARSIDLMLCIFPFEPQFYESAGLRALFVGHPMTSGIASAPSVIPSEVEESRCEALRVPPRDPSTSLGSAQDDAVGKRDPQLVALFPGSRQREVKKIFPVMREAARELSRSHPHLHFEIAAASESLAQALRVALSDDAMKFPIRVGHARELMMRASAGMIASGTATLEAALSRLPFVLVYRVAWLTYLAARLAVKVPWLGMPNVLVNREIVPEFIQHNARPRLIARAVARLLDDENARAAMLVEFDAINRALTTGEAGANAAQAIIAELRAPSALHGAKGRQERATTA
jgi:lipid-A-disaccharide synthase